MSVRVDYRSDCTVTEILESGVPAGSDKTLTHGGYNSGAVVMLSTSAPPVSKMASFEQALTAGVATIDLTALPYRGITVDGTGLRVQTLKVRGKSTNANPITISKGASNGYDGFGAAFSQELKPGAEDLKRTMDGGTDISGTNKNLDLVGTGAQVLEVLITMG